MKKLDQTKATFTENDVYGNRIKGFLFKTSYHVLRKVSRFIWPGNDKAYLKTLFRCRPHEKLDFDNPVTFNEKLQCLKFHYRQPICTRMVDKYEARKIVRERIGEEYLIPLLGVYDNFDEIDFDKLPDKFVLKANNDSGGVVICHDKSELDMGKARKRLTRSMESSYFWKGREYPYKDIKPRIIAEKMMTDPEHPDLQDYKFFCFNGEPRILFYVSCRQTQRKGNFDYFDVKTGSRLPITNPGYPHSDIDRIEVRNMDKMVEIASKLSEGFPFIRIDLYNIEGRVYFGEFTFFDGGGFTPYKPEEWSVRLGEWIKLPEAIALSASKS